MRVTTPYHPELHDLNTHIIMKHVVVSHYQIVGLVVEEGEADTFILVHYSSRCAGPLPESLN